MASGGRLGGAWEVALRYSYADFDDGIYGRKVENVTGGLNWTMNPNVRIMLNYVFSHVEDDEVAPRIDDDLHAVMMRLLVSW